MSFLLRADVVVARICIACIAGRPTGMVIGSQNDRADAQRQVCGGMALSHAPRTIAQHCRSGWRIRRHHSARFARRLQQRRLDLGLMSRAPRSASLR